jgi:hypothetical protein
VDLVDSSTVLWAKGDFPIINKRICVRVRVRDNVQRNTRSFRRSVRVIMWRELGRLLKRNKLEKD